MVYLLTCRACGIQYVGQTVDHFNMRWNNYKKDNRKALRGEHHMQAFFHSHFSEEGHYGFEEDCEITIIDKTDPSQPLRRESYWRDRLRTLLPDGLNTEENV